MSKASLGASGNGDAFDRFLEIGSVFDWISPVLAFGQDIANGPSHTFVIVGGPAQWTGLKLKQMLQEHGIRVWGAMWVSNKLLLTVKQRQAQWAEYLLERQGIMCCSKRFGKPGVVVDGEGRPVTGPPERGLTPASEGSKAQGVMDRMEGWLYGRR